MSVIFILEFLIISFFGWIIDTASRTWSEGHFSVGSFFRAPICPIYGIGGLILIFIFENFYFLPFYLLIILGAICMISLECLGGLFVEKVFMVRLWDYSKSKYNVAGYVDLMHSLGWLFLVSIFGLYIFPLVLKFEAFLVIPKYLDLPVSIIFLVVFLWFAVRKYPTRFLDFENKVLDLSVAEYRHLVSDIRKYYRAKSKELKNVLDERIKKRLGNTGARMKKRG